MENVEFNPRFVNGNVNIFFTFNSLCLGMVQLYSWLNLRFSADLWFHHDDSSTIYQLQAEICCTFALEDDDIQGLEHFY